MMNDTDNGFEFEVKCRGCHNMVITGMSGLSWLTTFSNGTREDYYLTNCAFCNKMTMTPVKDFPDNLQSDFWKQKLPYYIASKWCPCDKHPTERMVTLDRTVTNHILYQGVSYKCPVCRHCHDLSRTTVRYEVRDQAAPGGHFCIIL